MMRWWLGRPDRIMEWVSSSFISAMLLGKLWLVVGYLILFMNGFIYLKGIGLAATAFGAIVLAALATHGLLWWQVLRGGWALWLGADASKAGVVVGAVLWLLLLLGFQLLCLLAWYAISTPSTSNVPWLQF